MLCEEDQKCKKEDQRENCEHNHTREHCACCSDAGNQGRSLLDKSRVFFREGFNYIKDDLNFSSGNMLLKSLICI